MTPGQWASSMREDRLAFLMVPPGNLDEVLGELSGVVHAQSSLTYALDSDTRVAGQLSLAGSNYIDGAMVRIVHEVPAWGYRRELATLYPCGADMRRERGTATGTLDLASPLLALRDDRWVWNFGIPPGRQAHDVLSGIFERAQLSHRIEPSCGSYSYGETSVYAMGDSVLETAREVAEKMGCEIVPDGHGTVVVRPALSGAQRTPAFSLSDDDVTGAIEMSDVVYSTPNRVAATNKADDSVEVSAYVDAPPGAPSSLPRLGRRITEVIELGELSPATADAARREAQQALDGHMAGRRRYEFPCLHRPLREGDAVEFRAAGVAPCKCVVRTVELSLASGLPMRLTVEEA